MGEALTSHCPNQAWSSLGAKAVVSPWGLACFVKALHVGSGWVAGGSWGGNSADVELA